MPLRHNITREQLKQQIGEENIFTHYYGNWSYGSSSNSVFRKDEKASCGFYQTENGTVIYNDLRTGDKYDFVRFVMKKYNLSYFDALKHIAADFGIINGVPTNKVAAINTGYNTPKKALKKAFVINTIPYQKQHLDWWAQYAIDSNELKNAQIYAVDTFTYNKFDEHGTLVKTYTSPQNNEIKFVYSFKGVGDECYVKIYNPTAATDFKWVGDVPLKVPFGIDTLPCADFNKLIITKSVKDCLVLRKFFPETIAVQNESMSAFDAELLLPICKLYKKVILWFDFDRAGLYAANQYKKQYNFELSFTVKNNKNIWQNLTTVRERQIKDPSDFVKHYGLDIFTQYLKYIKLI